MRVAPPAPSNHPLVAFDGERLIAAGSYADVARAVDVARDGSAPASILVFDAVTSEPVDVDPRARAGTVGTMLVPQGESDGTDETPRRPGRPRLGVVAREVTLLPRHWDWLSAQPGGASAALRRLVEQARTANVARDRVRRAQESAYRFMSATMGDRPHFEEATRALFAGDRARFTALSDEWPGDLRDHARHLADVAFLNP